MKKGFLYGLLVLLIIILCFALWKFQFAARAYSSGKEEYREISEKYVSETEEESMDNASRAPATEVTEEPDIAESIPAPITVDFEALKKAYPDIVGWIYSEDTPINYPIVQTDNNDAYLHAAPDGSYLYAGSIFADFRCTPFLSCGNTILYGHHMNDGSMFASLVKYKKEGYREAHSVIWILTPEKTYRAYPFAGAVVSAGDDIYNAISNGGVIRENLQRIIENSSFSSDHQLTEDSQILTLSTCTYEFRNSRYVVVCLLES